MMLLLLLLLLVVVIDDGAPWIECSSSNDCKARFLEGVILSGIWDDCTLVGY
jgi:hypothetical protein